MRKKYCEFFNKLEEGFHENNREDLMN